MAQNKKAPEPITLKLLQWMFKIVSPILPSVMGNYAYQIWFTPQRFDAPQQEKAVAKKAIASYITIDNHRIRVWSWGEGPTVFFIHGWGGRGTQISSYVDILNQAGFKVMSLDMPSHGESDGKKTNVFIIEKAIKAILNQIDDLHCVITHSFGGAVFGHLYKSNIPVDKVVMFCPPATLNTAIDQFSQTLTLPNSVKNYITTHLKTDFGSDVFEKFSLIENAKAIPIPALIVHDKDDDIVPIQDGKTVADTLKQGTFIKTTGLGHRKILHDQKTINQVSSFIKS